MNSKVPSTVQPFELENIGPFELENMGRSVGGGCDAVAPKTTWLDVSWLMLSDVVGTSVLVFPGVAKQLGWVLTVVCIVGLFPLSLYVSVLMARTRKLLTDEARQQMPGRPVPRLGSMGEVARCVWGPRAGAITYIAVYGFNLLGQASYLLVLGIAIQQAFWSTPMCLPVAVALGCACLLAPVIAVRRLSESIGLCCLNTCLICAVIVVALGHLASLNRRACTQTHLVPPDLSFQTVLGQATNVIYAFSGQWMYFELMETMAVPGDFPHAFAITGPFMVTMYLAVSLLGYWLGGGDADLLAGMERGTALRAAAVMLSVHVAIVYLIKCVVLSRFFHGLCHPADLNARTAASYLRHGGFGLVMLSAGYVVANAVPFFSQLLGLIGGILAGPINFLLPIGFYLGALSRSISLQRERSSSDPAVEQINTGDTPGSRGDTSSGQRTIYTSTRSTFRHRLRTAADALLTLPIWEVAVVATTVILTAVIMVVGVADQVQQIIQLDKTYGAPFSCHMLAQPSAAGTPACPAAELGLTD